MIENVVEQIISIKSSKITIEETFEFSKEDFEKLSLTKKFSAILKQQYVDIFTLRYSYIGGISMFLGVTISLFCILRNYVILALVETPEARYWYKTGIFYLWYIITAHWICVLTYNSYWIPEEKFEAILEKKTLWDDYDETIKAVQIKRNFDQTFKVSLKHKNRMIDYWPDEQTGFRWRFCVICQRDSPPRSHHCVICNKCILKRDHHCFFTGKCIGYRNQRYFYFLCLFGFIGSIVGFVLEVYYIVNCSVIGIKSNWSDLFILKSTYKCFWARELDPHLLIIIIHIYVLPFFAAMCFGFLCFQTMTIIKGVTSDELNTTEEIRVNFGFVKRWQDVFGEYWLLNFFMPSQILFKQKGNGVDWPGTLNLTDIMGLKGFT